MPAANAEAQRRPRVAILGLHLEANAFAPPSTEADFRGSCYLEGAEILAEAAKPAPAMPAEVPAFIAEMNRSGDWEPVPILVTGVEPGGPAEHGFFERTLAEMRRRLAAAGPLDAIYLSNHGAMTTTEESDPDGAFYAMARAAVGPAAPVVATVDLHANISERMVEAVDAILAYRTNPHVDQRERAGEAARLIRRLLAGGRLAKAFVRMPIVAPSVRLLTATGPYADLIAYGQTQVSEALPIVSIVGGFAWSDTPKNGLAILAYGEDAGAANAVVDAIARRAWADRARYQVALTPLADAVRRSQAAGLSPTLPAVCIADVADNPGGGGRGNTTDILEALLAADVQGALLGLFVDADAATACHAAGVGASVDLVLNAGRADAYGREVPVRGEVLALSDGSIVGRRGIIAGRTVRLGRVAALRVGGLTCVLASRRIQAADPALFEAVGQDPGAFRTVVLKSRGHFRAGFDVFFTPEQIIEVDAGGLTNPSLERFDFKRLPRPVYPLDPLTEWLQGGVSM